MTMGTAIQSIITPSGKTKNFSWGRKKTKPKPPEKSHSCWEQRQNRVFYVTSSFFGQTLGHHAVWYSGPVGLFHQKLPTETRNSFKHKLHLELTCSFSYFNNLNVSDTKLSLLKENKKERLRTWEITRKFWREKSSLILKLIWLKKFLPSVQCLSLQLP